MCSFEQALPFVALAVFSGAEWEDLLRDRVDALLPGGGEKTRESAGEG